MENATSDFGKGLGYCLGLFLAHEAHLDETIRLYRDMRKKRASDQHPPNPDSFSDDKAAGLWIYAAADHLFEMTPEAAPFHLIERCAKFRSDVLGYRLPLKPPFITVQIANLLLTEAKELLRLLDEAHNVPTIQSTYP